MQENGDAHNWTDGKRSPHPTEKHELLIIYPYSLKVFVMKDVCLRDR